MIFRRLRAPVLVFLAAAFMHVAMFPAVPHDCRADDPAPAHDHGQDSGHTCCHAPCCQAGEPVEDDDESRSASMVSHHPVMPDLMRGRDVIFQLFRPPQTTTLPA